MPSEGKVGSLFLEFKTNIDQLVGEIRRLSNEMHSFGSTADRVSKQLSDLGHLGSASVNKFANDLGQLTSGISSVNRFVAQATGGIADLGHIGSAAVSKFSADLGGLASNLSNVNTFIQQATKGVSDLGHIGSAAVTQLNNDLGRLTSGISSVNTFRATAPAGTGDLGHLGGAAIKQFSSDLGGLASNLNQVNTFVAQAQSGISDLGHIGSTAAKQVTGDLGGLTSGISTVNTFVAKAGTAFSDLGHLGSASINQVSQTFTQRAEQLSSELRKFDRTFYPIERRATQLGFALTAMFTAPTIAAGAFALKVGTSFENAFAGVRKTVTATDTQFAALRQQLIDLSKILPINATEFANIAAAVGQLGIEVPKIADFTKTMAELEIATNLTAVAGGKVLTRFAGVTDLPDDKIHNLASALALLGDEFKADEAEILNFAQRMASVGSFVGLTSQEILGFATGLREVGVQAEAGATAITRVFAEIDKAVTSGGTKLEQFAVVAGKPFEEFSKQFKEKPAEAITAFIEGLNRIEAEGGNVFTTLESLSLQNVRIRDTLLAAAAGEDALSRAVRTSTEEFDRNTKLSREVTERLKTVTSQWRLLRAGVEEVAILLFDTFAPAINGTLIPALKSVVEEGIKPLVEWFSKLPPGMRQAVEGAVLFAAVVGPALLVVTKLISFIGGAALILSELFEKSGIAKLAGTGSKLESVLAGLTGAATKLALPLTVIGTIITAWEIENVIIDILGLGKQFDEAKSSAIELGRAVLGLVGVFGQLVITRITEEIKKFKDIVETALGPVKQLAILLILPQIIRANVELKAVTALINDLSKAMDGAAGSTKGAATETDRLLENLKPWAQVTAAAGSGGRGTIGPSAEDIKAQADAAEELRKEHERLIERFTAELAPANALNQELDFLLKHFSASQVIAIYGDKIVEATEAQWDHNLAVSGSVGVLYEQAKALQKVREMVEEIRKIDVETIMMPITGTVPGPQTNAIELKALTDYDNAKQQIEDLGAAIKNLDFLGVNAQIALFNGDLDQAAKFAEAFGLELDPVIVALLQYKQALEQSAAGTKAWEDAANAGLKTADDMATQIATTAEAIRRMQAKQIDHNVILEILGKTIDEAAENIRKLGIDINSLDPALQVFIRFRELMNEAKDEATEFEREMSRITTKIVNDLANGIADALLGSGSIVDIGIKIGKDFAAAFVRAVVSEMVAPLVAKFQELGRTLAKHLADVHPVIKGIVAAVTIAVVAIKALGNTHLFANQFVKETQNPFGKSIEQFIKANDELFASGRQTFEGAQQAREKVDELWQGFLEDAEKFGQQGRKQATVAAQAIATLEPVIKRVIVGIENQIESLKPPSIRATEYVNQLIAFNAAVASNTEEYIASVQAQMAELDDLIKWTQMQIAAQDDLGGSSEDLNRIMRDLILQWNDLYDSIHPVVPEVYSFAEAVRAMSESLVPDKTAGFLDEVLNATLGSANLEEALSILEKIGTPVAIIIDRLGKDMEDFANALALSGLPIPPLIDKYLKLKKASEELDSASKKASGEMPRIANSLSKLVGDAVNQLRNIAGGGDLAQSILDALARLLTGLPTPTAPAESVIRDAIDKLRGVAENIFVTLQKLVPSGPTDLALTQSSFNVGGSEFAVPHPAITQVMIHIEDNEVITNKIYFTDEISREVVRDRVIPEITEALTNNTDSVQEKWTRRLNKARE